MSSTGEPSDEKLRQFHDKLKGISQGNYLSNLLAWNNFKKCTFYSTSVSEIRSKDQREVGNVDYSQIAEISDIFVDDYDKTLLSNDDIEKVNDYPQNQRSVLIVIQTNTRQQSGCSSWYEERRKRITSSNFGRIINRKKAYFLSLS